VKIRSVVFTSSC